MPLLEDHLVARLLERYEASPGDALVPEHRGLSTPLCAVYDAASTLVAATGALDADRRRLRDLLEVISVTTLDETAIEEWADPFRLRSVNTSVDLRAARRLLQRASDDTLSEPIEWADGSDANGGPKV